MLLLALAGFVSELPVVGSRTDILLFLLPVHVWRHLRGTFGGRRLVTLARTILLGAARLGGFASICLLLVLIGLAWG